MPNKEQKRAAKGRAEFGPAKAFQRAYERGIREVAARILVARAPGQTEAQWLDALAERARAPDVLAASERLAESMVGRAAASNAKTWREAASRSGQARRLRALLEAEMAGATGSRVRELVRENAKLIRSLPLEAATTLAGEVERARLTGARPATVAKMAGKRFPQLLASRTRLIARTETAKASTALTKARCERLAVEWYQWESSQDGDRVRESHRNMQGVIVPWSQPPDPEALVGIKSTLGRYHAGECPNCRCVVIPILTLDDVAFPARVYWNGSVSRMTKQQFKQIAVGLEERAA